MKKYRSINFSRWYGIFFIYTYVVADANLEKLYIPAAQKALNASQEIKKKATDYQNKLLQEKKSGTWNQEKEQELDKINQVIQDIDTQITEYSQVIQGGSTSK